jgi:hypothetical protein
MNRVNEVAVGKFSKALSSWKTFIKNLISSEGGGFEKVQQQYPQISRQDYSWRQRCRLKPRRAGSGGKSCGRRT